MLTHQLDSFYSLIALIDPLLGFLPWADRLKQRYRLLVNGDIIALHHIASLLENGILALAFNAVIYSVNETVKLSLEITISPTDSVLEIFVVVEGSGISNKLLLILNAEIDHQLTEISVCILRINVKCFFKNVVRILKLTVGEVHKSALDSSISSGKSHGGIAFYNNSLSRIIDRADTRNNRRGMINELRIVNENAVSALGAELRFNIVLLTAAAAVLYLLFGLSCYLLEDTNGNLLG